MTLPYEKQVFSQNGEDGIIEFLLQYVTNTSNNFLEIGWGRGNQNCCRNLLVNKNFTGTGVDPRKQKVKSPGLNFVNKYATLDNVEEMLGYEGLNPTVFSLDIDSYDWFLLREMLDKNFRPSIIVHEYNSLLGNDKCYARLTSAPYDKRCLYGASLPAYRLLLENDYRFVTCDSNGVNAFWLHKDYNINDDYKYYSYKKISTVYDLTVEDVLEIDNGWIEIR